jgi:hypothetical protein
MNSDKKPNESKPTAAAGAPVSGAVDREAMLKKSKPIAQVSNVWIGNSPEMVAPGIPYDAVEVFHAEDLVGQDLIVCGYSMRSGDRGDFAVVCCVPPTSKVSVFTTGSAVVLRKLKLAGEQRAFPVSGKLTKAQGKRGLSYFDFTATA